MVAKQGEFLYRIGDPANRIFFLGLGKIEIVSKEEKCIKVLSVGAAIREGSLFGINKIYILGIDWEKGLLIMRRTAREKRLPK